MSTIFCSYYWAQPIHPPVHPSFLKSACDGKEIITAHLTNCELSGHLACVESFLFLCCCCCAVVVVLLMLCCCCCSCFVVDVLLWLFCCVVVALLWSHNMVSYGCIYVAQQATITTMFLLTTSSILRNKS